MSRVIACVLREVREETGLQLKSFECFGFSSDPALEIFCYPKGDETHSFSLLVFSRDWQGELVQGNDEAAAARIFAREALPELLPNERRSLDRYFAYLTSGRFQLS